MTGIVVGMDDRSLFNDNGAAFAFFLINFLYGFGGLLTAYVFSFAGRSAPGSYTYYLMMTVIVGECKVCCFDYTSTFSHVSSPLHTSACILPVLIYYLRLIAPDIMYIYDDGVEIPDPYYNGPDLIVMADVLRYMFTWFPGFPHCRATMALLNVSLILLPSTTTTT